MPFSPSNPPIRGGSYSRFVVKQRASTSTGSIGTLAIPIVHDWGPFKVPTQVGSLAEFVQVFGEGVNGPFDPTPGYLALYNAFKGEDGGHPGASSVIVYRTGGAAAAKASATVKNTTPADAITLQARYEGARGNNLQYAVEVNADDATKNDLVILEAGNELERFTHDPIDLASLQTAVNDSDTGSDWVTLPTVTVDGVALGVKAATSLTGGDDGATLAAGDWTAAESALESQQFECFVPYDLTDASIQTSLATWCSTLNNQERSKRFMLMMGGAGDETVTAALTAAQGFNDENVARVGVGTYKDTDLGVTMSTSQLAPRVAGIAVARGFHAALDFAHLAGLEIVTGPTDAEITKAIDPTPNKGGLIVLSQDAGGVRIEQGLTTYVANTSTKPKETFSRFKYAFTMQSFERTLQERWENGQVAGQLEVNKETRDFLVGDARTVLDTIYVPAGAVQKGATVGVAVDPPPSDDDEFVALDWVAKFGRTLRQIRSTFYMS